MRNNRKIASKIYNTAVTVLGNLSGGHSVKIKVPAEPIKHCLQNKMWFCRKKDKIRQLTYVGHVFRKLFFEIFIIKNVQNKLIYIFLTY